ncbi:MAG: SdpI family protein [Usitatibacter sp.]
MAVIEKIMNSILTFLVPCGLIALASIPLMLNAVPPNSVYGFRTRQTLTNRELWFRANRFAGCALFIASGISAAIFVAHPEYVSGRSHVGLVVFIAPLAAALVASFAYLRLISGGDDDDG